MRIECLGCQKVYKLPDEQLPVGKQVSFPCPSCKTTIKLDLRSKAKTDSPAPGIQTPKNEPKIESGPAAASAAQQLYGKELMNKILKKIGDLPPMSQVVLKARKVMADKKSGFKKIAEVLETDQAIAAGVLKMANSAFYGLSCNVSSIHQATVILGYKILGQLITVMGASKNIDKTLKGYKLGAGVLWRHSLAVAFGSKVIAEKKYPVLDNDAFTAGLIHDSGKIILDNYVYARKKEFDNFIKSGKQSFIDAEKEILGFDHSQISYEICRLWNFPESIALAIKYHHNPSLSQSSELAYILHLADSIAVMGGIGAENKKHQIEEGAMEYLGFDEDDLNQISDEVVEYVNNLGKNNE